MIADDGEIIKSGSILDKDDNSECIEKQGTKDKKPKNVIDVRFLVECEGTL